jgi:hypothetical protein
MRLKTHVKRVFRWVNLFARSVFVGIALDDVISNAAIPVENGLRWVLSCTSRDFLRDLFPVFSLTPKSNHSTLAALHGDNPSRISQPSTQ